MLVSQLIERLQKLDQNAQILVETWMIGDIQNLDHAFENLSDEKLCEIISAVEQKGVHITDDIIIDTAFNII